MKIKPLISVIIPCYNVGKFIEECVRSVQKQTYPTIEIICINDGSSDNTEKVLDYLRQRLDKKIQVYHQKNGGSGKARNKGLNIAKGEYIQFLDADDILKKDKIRHQVQLINDLDYEPDIIAAAVEKHFEDGRIKIAKNEILEPWVGLAKYKIGITSSNLWKRKSLLDVGGFDEMLQSNQEHDLIFRMLKNGASVVYDKEPLTVKRERNNGSISSGYDKFHLERKVRHRMSIYNYTKSRMLLTEDVLQYLLERNIQDLKNMRESDTVLAFSIYDELISDEIKLYNQFSIFYRKIFNLFGFKKAEILRSYFGKANLIK